MAVADSLDGPWVDLKNDPVLSTQHLPPSPIEASNIWRGYLVLSRQSQSWYIFFNAGAQNGGELVSFARQNKG
jgi:hypothetical protein